MAQRVKIETEYIQLQQFLKLINLVSSGGEAKEIIQQGIIKVNGEVEIRRGRKLYSNDSIIIEDVDEFIII
ncbi:S4 domain-containing protein YaaA [Alkalicella caledoniensis]|uniref:S4 domain-containing protein YaaA n=1 Tax=Alkalicella caledoniensis TaxID=2731377 RepID=A0A7G9W8I5_ALKCA|nr:S4 domain-containing protein YaaA [Alkalicella caledoniensis]QNO14997.1 S4 domain-containing protein YaaA [Alkalicella caledoniensis]